MNVHQIFESYDKWAGLIPILGGVYALLLAYKIVPVKAATPEASDNWHNKFGKILKIIAPMMTLGGIVSIIFSLLK